MLFHAAEAAFGPVEILITANVIQLR